MVLLIPTDAKRDYATLFRLGSIIQYTEQPGIRKLIKLFASNKVSDMDGQKNLGWGGG